MTIDNVKKAKEVLFDVGYFRLGFYWFPFELSYPEKNNRDHKFKASANFDDAVKLYYFDFKLRSILLKAISRIEIAFRTKVIYLVSNDNQSKPTWFADPSVVSSKQAREFKEKVYDDLVAHYPVIAMHHRHHINDIYAPAWKTMEFMTLGAVLHLFRSIKDENIKQKVAAEFNIRHLAIFINYMELIFCKVKNKFIPLHHESAGTDLMLITNTIKRTKEVVHFAVRPRFFTFNYKLLPI